MTTGLREERALYRIGRALLWLGLAEPAAPLSEADLSRLWSGQAFPPEALRTEAGRPVQVIFRGRPNGGAGPDFRDAVLLIDGEEQRGDVELHVLASGFRGHGHHEDAAYDRVVLHFVYRADDGAETALSDGGRTPVVALAWLEKRRGELKELLAAPALWQEPCREAEARLGGEAISAALVAAGRQRFAGRVASLAIQIRELGAETAVWRCLIDALGVGGDRAGFRRLAVAFSPRLAQSLVAGLVLKEAVARLTAALLAVAGLTAAPDDVGVPASLSPPIAAVGRPANRPERRLIALASLYLRAGGDLTTQIEASVAQAPKAKALVAAWQVADDQGRPALLGPERAQELVVNAVLPLAVALQPVLAAKAEALLQDLRPTAAYGKTAFLEANLQRPDGKRRVVSVLEQQGLLGFLEEWCSRGGCGKCPLS